MSDSSLLVFFVAVWLPTQSAREKCEAHCPRPCVRVQLTRAGLTCDFCLVVALCVLLESCSRCVMAKSARHGRNGNVAANSVAGNPNVVDMQTPQWPWYTFSMALLPALLPKLVPVEAAAHQRRRVSAPTGANRRRSTSKRLSDWPLRALRLNFALVHRIGFRTFVSATGSVQRHNMRQGGEHRGVWVGVIVVPMQPRACFMHVCLPRKQKRE